MRMYRDLCVSCGISFFFFTLLSLVFLLFSASFFFFFSFSHTYASERDYCWNSRERREKKKREDEREKADRLSFVIIIVAHFSCLVSTTLLNSFFLCVFVSLSLSLVFDSHYTSLIVNARMTFFVEYLIKNSS